MKSTTILPSIPRCPYCRSRHVLELSSRSIVLASVGAAIGTLVVIIASLPKHKSDKGKIVGPLVVGMLTGASAGLSYDSAEPRKASSKRYLCLTCFHRFT
jgi:DNA-directed RNA polymerase subunit RPC12/RpoP